MIMPCMNATSAGERAGRTPFVEDGSVLVGFPGAPGCTTTGAVAESVCCAARKGRELNAAPALAASSTPHSAAQILSAWRCGMHATRKRSILEFSASLNIFIVLVPSGRYRSFGRTIIIQMSKSHDCNHCASWLRLNLRVHQKGIVELGHLAGLLSGHRLQTRRQRFVPFHRKAGDVAQDALQLLRGHIATHRNSVESRAADRRVRKQRIG